MNRSTTIATDFFPYLPEIIIQKICELLISSLDFNKLEYVLAFRSTSLHLYHTINNCSLKLTYFILLPRFLNSGEKLKQQYFLSHLKNSTNWNFDQLLIDSTLYRYSTIQQEKQQDALKQYFEQQKSLICNQFYKLFDVKLKSVLLSLRYPSPDTIPKIIQFTDDIFEKRGHQATTIALSISIMFGRELATIKGRYAHHVKKLTITQKQLYQFDFVHKIVKMFPNVEDLAVMSTCPSSHTFETTILNEMPKIVSFKSNIVELATSTTSNSRTLDQIKTLQLKFRHGNAASITKLLNTNFPNLENLMLSSFLENVQTNETPLFMNSKNLRTLKANLSFLSRIYTPNLSKLEELCIFYDAFNAQLLNNFFSSSDLSALRILKIEKEQSITISFENLWKITIDILRKIKHLKVLIIRGNDFLSFVPDLLQRPQNIGPELLYFNFFERILTNQLDLATIRRLDELDSEYKWNLRSSNRVAGGM